MKQVLDIIPLIVSLLMSLVGLISAIVKVVKAKNWNAVKAALCDFMVKAESSAETGEGKKQLVLEWVKDFCQQQGYKFDEQQVSSAIEKLIDFSKRVNPREKDTLAS